MDLIGNPHPRDPAAGWVRQLLEDCFSAAGISNGRLSRRVHRTGRIWGEGLTGKAGWHVVKEFAAETGITKLANARPPESVCEALPCG